MRYPLLQWILDQEGPDFQTVQNRWRPVDILFLQQVRALLADMERRYKRLEGARPELETLERSERYTKLLTRMRLWLRQASYNWKANHLIFIQAVAGFYSEYGILLRYLKFDQTRGRLADRDAGKQGV